MIKVYLCYELKSFELDKSINSCIRVIQKNSIESSLQSCLSYIPIQMVCANYCAPYPKWPCVRHEVNIWCTCYIMSLLLELSTFFSLVTWSMLWPHHQMWLITSNPNLWVLKIEKCKIIEKKMKMKMKNRINWSLLFCFLTYILCNKLLIF